MATMQLTLIIRYSLLSIFQSFYIIMEYPVLISLALFGQFGFCTKTLTCGCFRISRSGRKTACFRSTRVQSGTPTVFSLCSGKIHAMWHYIIKLYGKIKYLQICFMVIMQQPNSYFFCIFFPFMFAGIRLLTKNLLELL